MIYSSPGRKITTKVAENNLQPIEEPEYNMAENNLQPIEEPEYNMADTNPFADTNPDSKSRVPAGVMTYLDIDFLEWEDLLEPGVEPKATMVHIATYRINDFFGKDKPFVEYVISADGSFPTYEFIPAQGTDVSTTVINGCFGIIRQLVSPPGFEVASENDFMSSTQSLKNMYRGFWKTDVEGLVYLFLNWSGMPLNESESKDKWKSISEIMYLSEISGNKSNTHIATMFGQVPRIQHLYRSDFTKIPQPMFLYGPEIMLRTMDDRFGNFYVFVEPKQVSKEYPSKYLVSIPDRNDILFVIRDPLYKIPTEVLDGYSERFRESHACMYYEHNRNVWIIKDANNIYNIENMTPEDSERQKHSSTVSVPSTRETEDGASIFDSIKETIRKLSGN